MSSGTGAVRGPTGATAGGTGKHPLVDMVDMAQIVRRRRWRQASQFGMFIFLNFGLMCIGYALLAVRRGGLPTIWGVVVAAVIAIGLLAVAGSVALMVAVNRGRLVAISVARAFGAAVVVVYAALGALVALASHQVLGAAVFGGFAAFFAVVMFPGTVAAARGVRAMAGGGREGLLNSLVLGQGRLRDLLGRRPELSRVPPWHLYTVLGATYLLGLGVGFALNFPHTPVAIVIETVGGLALWLLVSLAMRRYINWRMLDLSSALEADRRPPVLYLRSFASDHRRVWTFPRMYPDFAGQSYRISIPYDEFVGEALGQAGPVIAIGEPGRRTKTTGVATQQLDDSVWKDKARALIDGAGAIVMLAGRTEGVRWEIEQLVTARQLDKTVLLLPKSSSPQSVADWHALCDILEDHGVTGLRESVDLRRTVAVLPQEDGPPTVIRVKRKSSSSYAVGIRAALLLRMNPQGALARVLEDTHGWRRFRIPAFAGLVVFILLTVIGGPLGALEAYAHSTNVASDVPLTNPGTTNPPIQNTGPGFTSGNTGPGNTTSGNTGSGTTGSGNTGSGNTGSGNTGSANTGSGNTGSGNTGSGSTGSGSTGSGNTGAGNTASGNTGSGNTGSGNTGSGNTGSANTGSGNTGSGNTGTANTGSGNTGSGNTGSGSTGSGDTGSGNTGGGG